MQFPRKRVSEPGVAPAEHPPSPALVPAPGQRPSNGKWWLLAMFIVIAGAVAYWQLQPARSEAGAGRQLLAGIRTAKAGSGTVTPTLRLAGTTAAEKYVNITGPRMKGSRSRRGASLAGASIGLRTNITVSSTSSVAPTATMSVFHLVSRPDGNHVGVESDGPGGQFELSRGARWRRLWRADEWLGRDARRDHPDRGQ